TITAISTVIARVKPSLVEFSPFLQRLFLVSNFWVVTRVLASVFAIMVYFKLGSEMFYGEDTGQQLLDSLLHVLFSVFLFAGFFLPLLTNFGLLEFIGDRKSTRLNSSHVSISYAVFCLKKTKITKLIASHC